MDYVTRGKITASGAHKTVFECEGIVLAFDYCAARRLTVTRDVVTQATREHERKRLDVCYQIGLRTYGHGRSWRETVRIRLSRSHMLNDVAAVF